MAGGVILWLCLEVSYRIFVNPLYEYSGFALEPISFKYLEAWFLYAICLTVAPRRLVRPSDIFLIILYFGLVTPLLIFYALAGQPREHLYIILVGITIIELMRRGRLYQFRTVKEGRLLAIGFLVIGTVVVSSWLIVAGGLTYFNLDLTKVYMYRGDVGDAINIGVMGYINMWAYKVFGPALLAIALWKKRFNVAIGIITLHIFWFAVSSHKSVLLYPALILFIWAWFTRTKALSFIPIAMSGVIALAMIVYLVADYALPASLFVRRVFFVIANNTFYYYEFFAHNEFVFWSNSVTEVFAKYPYDVNPPKLLGEVRGTNNHVNNGFLATGFMHAGITGVILYSIMVGLLFRLIDSIAAAGIPTWVAVCILIVPSRSLLLAADLPTALLTHGIGIGIIVLLLIRKVENGKRGSARHMYKGRSPENDAIATAK